MLRSDLIILLMDLSAKACYTHQITSHFDTFARYPKDLKGIRQAIMLYII